MVILDCTFPFVEDRNYAKLVTFAGSVYSTCDANIEQWHASKKAVVQERVKVELFARFLLLRIMLEVNPSLTFTEFRDCQLNGGSYVIEELITLLEDVPPVQLASINHPKNDGYHFFFLFLFFFIFLFIIIIFYHSYHGLVSFRRGSLVGKSIWYLLSMKRVLH
jgi:hypothetical protein